MPILHLTEREIESRRHRSLTELAPKFADRLRAAIAECQAVPASPDFPHGLDVFVFEAIRTQEVQEAYYARGRNSAGVIVNRHEVVTNARSPLYGWHFYGLAVDITSATKWWDFGDADKRDGDDLEWIRAVAKIMARHGIDWGGDWPAFKDFPHFQFGGMKHSPSNLSRTLYANGVTHAEGLRNVWRAVGAL